jgi:capsular polysaccharide biosynthesis protein
MKKYIDPILRWWWLIILCTLIAGVTCYLSVRNLPPVYEVHATLIVGSSLNKANPNSSEFYLEQQLASVYATIGSQGQLSEPTMKALELESLPKYYISPIPNSALIDIVVSDTDPARAQAVANELARQLIKTSPSGDAAQSEQRQAFINEQLDKMQAEIKATDEQIVEQNELLGQANSARKIADIQRQISALEQKRNTLQANYTNLLANTEEGAPNSLSIVQEASLPTQPVGPNKLLYMALASVLGLFLSTGSAYVIELLDTGIKTKEEVEAIFNAPVLGELPSFPKSEAALYTARNPRSPITDAFRSLRTNLEFMGINEPMRTC